jgi:hypothetical protein
LYDTKLSAGHAASVRGGGNAYNILTGKYHRNTGDLSILDRITVILIVNLSM